jgi:hypothetical protein
MATLSSNSTDAEVWAAYDDNASYEEDASRAKALAFVTVGRILRRRIPLSVGRAKLNSWSRRKPKKHALPRTRISRGPVSRRRPWPFARPAPRRRPGWR